MRDKTGMDKDSALHIGDTLLDVNDVTQYARLSYKEGNIDQQHAIEAFIKERQWYLRFYRRGNYYVELIVTGDDYILIHNLIRAGLCVEATLWQRPKYQSPYNQGYEKGVESGVQQ